MTLQLPLEISQKRADLHRRVQRLAYNQYLRWGRIPEQIQAVVDMTQTDEALCKGLGLGGLGLGGRGFDDDFEAKYSPDQPRAPRGSSDGGQWVSGGGGTGSRPGPSASTNSSGRSAGGGSSPAATAPGSAPTAPTRAASTPSTSGRQAGLPPIPTYKDTATGRITTSVTPKDWAMFNAELGHRTDLSDEEKRAYREVFSAEGGFRKNPNGTAYAGILSQTLKEYVSSLPEEQARVLRMTLSDPETGNLSPKRLSENQVLDVYKFYFDDRLQSVGGSKALAKIGDPLAAAALADTLFREGKADGARRIAEAINMVSPGRIEIESAKITFVGPKIFPNYVNFVKNPATRDRLLDALAASRATKVPKEKKRFDRFRFMDERKGGIGG